MFKTDFSQCFQITDKIDFLETVTETLLLVKYSRKQILYNVVSHKLEGTLRKQADEYIIFYSSDVKKVRVTEQLKGVKSL